MYDGNIYALKLHYLIQCTEYFWENFQADLVKQNFQKILVRNELFK